MEKRLRNSSHSLPAVSTMHFLWFLSCFALLWVTSGHGEPASLPELSIRPRIVNGQEAHPGAWPWNVALVNHQGYPCCGGVLIRRNWVVTAAHCNFTVASRAVLGLYDRRSPGDIQGLRIVQIFRHPNFNRTTRHSDIALLKLRLGAHFNHKVSPLRLPRVDDQFLPGSWCKIMGWGYTDVNGTRKPNKLQEASVTILDNSICNRLYPHLSPDVIFCAWRRGVSPHRGDSGSSTACLKNGVWTLAGILSCTRDSEFIKMPFAVTRISAFLPWIEETLANN